ncbi:hypothetical protein HZH68_015168 [Vespula germanica]|uniref:Uncharacterized protein n=1 Tax=Vespula germanica TaxID=30212 RepID=A0A834J7N5_VESGE|nr:hypothetical protein HZH68_015168 [Vespula germanica]
MNSDVSVQIKDEDDINWDEITDDKLQDLLVNMVRMKMILDLENDFFYRYLQRNDPESLKKIDAVSVSDTLKVNCPKITGHGTSSSPTSSNISVRDRGSPSIWSMQSGIRRGMLDPMLRRLRITIAQRMELMQNEIIEFKNKLMLLERTGKKEKNKLNAEIEGLEICIREIKETKDRFENDIVIGGVDRITGKIPAETVMKLIDDPLILILTTY